MADLHKWRKEEARLARLQEATHVSVQEWYRAAQLCEQEGLWQDLPSAQHLGPTMQGRQKGWGQEEGALPALCAVCPQKRGPGCGSNWEWGGLARRTPWQGDQIHPSHAKRRVSARGNGTHQHPPAASHVSAERGLTDLSLEGTPSLLVARCDALESQLSKRILAFSASNLSLGSTRKMGLPRFLVPEAADSLRPALESPFSSLR